MTGASGGLGAPTCDRISAEGGTVVCTDVGATGDGSSPDRCRELDVTDRRAWQSLVAEIMAEYGRLDGALFAHGVAGPVTLAQETSASDWAHTIEVNLTGAFYGLRALVPVMRRTSYGRIVAVSSIGAVTANPRQAAYSASKAGLNALVKSVAKECADDSVTVNTIAPSLMDTPMLAGLDEARFATLLAKVPLGRPGTALEFAALAGWLLSSEASFVTGQVVDLSGGRNQ
ncbi:SDR family oxidoreductase [Nonomuraea lactucae]|uniref:SDR family oxidoreductase n=1 Tax=Nonomuraea lactucae TaxID=2249762 RepID=UPI0013B44446|nr:SDR family NAD(P)-dependent oxidoreductase [Nonomuraea lactucae]